MPNPVRSAEKKRSKKAKKPVAKRPTRAPKEQKPGAKLLVKQVKSGIGHAETYKRTLVALGLRHQAEIVVSDNPSIRGMLSKVHHLVSVKPQGA